MFIARVLLAELLCENALLGAGLDVEGDNPNGDEDQAARSWKQGEVRADECKDEAGVERVTDRGIWTALDKFVVFLYDYEAAPVSTKDVSCPDGKREACRAEDDSAQTSSIT